MILLDFNAVGIAYLELSSAFVGCLVMLMFGFNWLELFAIMLLGCIYYLLILLMLGVGLGITCCDMLILLVIYWFDVFCFA